MKQSRRRFLYQSLAVIAGPKLMSNAPHVVLLGDSIFDNAAYTAGKPDVVTQLRRVLPKNGKATLLARDGATTAGIPSQLAQLPPDASHLVLSIGGNDALMRQDLLRAPAASVAEAILMLAEAVHPFEEAYRKVVAACLARRLPLVVCTIYNGNFDDARYRQLTRTAIALFDDAILRIAVEHRLKVIELRLVCAKPEDYANPIEPSSAGAEKIARAILIAVTETAADGRGALLLGGRL
jgi:lysophospholipase L1-like esterase